MPIDYPTPSSISSSTSSTSYDSDAEEARVQAEWQESVRQMEMLLSIVVLPMFGKYMGRRWMFWGMSIVITTELTSKHTRGIRTSAFRERSLDWLEIILYAWLNVPIIHIPITSNYTFSSNLTHTLDDNWQA